MDRHRPLFAGTCLDSGAYSVAQTGKSIDLDAYIDFCKLHGAAYDFIASLDVIGGSPFDNWNNWQRMLRAGVPAVPTFHSDEDLDVLRAYVAESDRVGIGFIRKDGRLPPRAAVCKTLDKCFRIIPERVKVHGWGLTGFCDFPFWSVDSTTWLWEVKALLAVAGQGDHAIACLTPSELVEIVQKKYERLGKRQRWEGI